MNDTLGTDKGQEPGHDLGMALYLAEWLTAKNVKPADLARQIRCSRSLVSKWATKERPLKDINWITKICAALEISPEQLSKIPPESGGKLIVSSEGLTKSIGAASEAALTKGIEMIEKRVQLHEALEEIPDELLDTATSLINRLKGLGGTARPYPIKRGSTKS